jgi:hypothetical protein
MGRLDRARQRAVEGTAATRSTNAFGERAQLYGETHARATSLGKRLAQHRAQVRTGRHDRDRLERVIVLQPVDFARQPGE